MVSFLEMIAISFITKLNLYLVRIRLVVFSLWIEYSFLKHFSLIATFYLHVT